MEHYRRALKLKQSVDAEFLQLKSLTKMTRAQKKRIQELRKVVSVFGKWQTARCASTHPFEKRPNASPFANVSSLALLPATSSAGKSVYVRESASLACLIPVTPLSLAPLPAALGLVVLLSHHPRLAAPAAWALGQELLLRC
jgi:hypothetical protein